MDGETPVTILSGSLGAGKTTTLNHLLENPGNRSIAVLVNDLGAVNVDADLLSAGTDLAADGGIAELSNGCICCELQDDLESEVARLASEREFDYLVVESSGISEPEPVARLFTTASRAAAAYDLDTLVTVVDADGFLETFGDRDRVERETAPGSDERPLADLLVEQIEYANVILLNKCDLVDEAGLGRAEALIEALAPSARILRTIHGRVDPDDVLGTGRFGAESPGGTTGRKGTVAEGTDHGPEERAREGHDHGDETAIDHNAHPDEVYGVTSVTYRRRRPFHPDRLQAFLRDLPRAVVRAKGPLWVAGRPDTAMLLNQAGPNVRIEALGPWLASLPEVERDLYRSNRPDVAWDDEYGDRRTELVFIGHEVGEDLLAGLDNCLVTDEEWTADLHAEGFPTTDGEALSFRTRE